MRQLLLEFEREIERFLDQRERILLVVDAGPAEHIALMTLVDGLEQRREHDVFWSIPANFESEVQFARDIVEFVHLRAQSLAVHWEQEESEPMPPFPASSELAALPPIACVQRVLTFARSLIRELEGRVMVVVFAPAVVGEARAFAAFVTELLRHEVRLPWCHHMRFVVRDVRGQAVLSALAQPLPRCTVTRPDLGPEALANALETEVNDPQLSLPMRMQSLLLLAALDTSHGRVEASIEKYQLLLRYHHGLGDKSMIALCLNGIGEACARAGDFASAKKYLEGALTPALESKAIPVVFNATFNLAHLHTQHRRYEEARAYHRALDALAGAASNVALRLYALENLGVCERHLGRVGEAVEYWKQAITLAEGIQAAQPQIACLEHLRAVFVDAQMEDRARGIDLIVARLRASEQAGRAVVEV